MVKNYQKFIIIIGIIIVLLVGGLVFFEFQRQEEIKQAKVNYETASINLIKASINVYYAFDGKYPYNMQTLIERLKELGIKDNRASKLAEQLDKSIKDLPNLKYSVRGDEKAYKITYTNSKGEEKTIEANYEADFQDR